MLVTGQFTTQYMTSSGKVYVSNSTTVQRYDSVSMALELTASLDYACSSSAIARVVAGPDSIYTVMKNSYVCVNDISTGLTQVPFATELC